MGYERPTGLYLSRATVIAMDVLVLVLALVLAVALELELELEPLELALELELELLELTDPVAVAVDDTVTGPSGPVGVTVACAAAAEVYDEYLCVASRQRWQSRSKIDRLTQRSPPPRPSPHSTTPHQ